VLRDPALEGFMASDEEVLAHYQGADIDYDSIEHWRAFLRHVLLINRCTDCGYWIYPNLPSCPRCWSGQVVATEVEGRGRVFMFVVYHGGMERSWRGPTGRTIQQLVLAGPTSADEPYAVAAVELDEQVGLRFTAPVLGAQESLSIGARAVLTWTEQDHQVVPAWLVDGVDGRTR
jgi:uncharacterized protein